MPNQRGVFLWGPELPPPSPGTFRSRDDSWWLQYHASLRLPPAAINELAEGSRNIVSLLPDPQNWSDNPRPFKGLVVGAVQSGKTGSMIGVSAVALDQGYRLIIVLAGTRDDLRQQTARRFNTQLLRQCDVIPGTTATTLGTLPGPGPLGGFALPYSLDATYFNVLQVKIRVALEKNEPCILVIKKNSASLSAVRAALSWCITKYSADALPTLVLDDECDDASVDSQATTIPGAIANLWRNATPPPVAYVGYTATSAANLLQHQANDLYPSNFVTLIRFPGERDTPLQYDEPSSDAFYIGGSTYYEVFGTTAGEEDNFLIDTSVTEAEIAGPPSENASLTDATRGYFVSGAMRLALAADRSFQDPSRFPSPHSMLIQASADTADHQRWATDIRISMGGELQPDHSVRFSASLLAAQLEQDEVKWRAWFDRFERSRERIYAERPHPGVYTPLTWQKVKVVLPEIFLHTRMKVINSDPELGSSLDFEKRLSPNGDVLFPQDCYVIVVGGAKLSRGLTIEGLCISYFVRRASNPTEDTVLQLSRWFGYRGTHLEFCRLFTLADMYGGLLSMHGNDMDLRLQLAGLMAERRSPAEAVLVIRANPRSLPTAKMGTGLLLDIAFSPFNGVLPHVEIGSFESANQDFAVSFVNMVRSRPQEDVTTPTGKLRGVLSRGWSADNAAAILDQLAFTEHNPHSEETPLREFCRPHDPSRPSSSSFAAIDDPYQVAAYLRAWAQAARVDTEIAPPPSFTFAVSYGELGGDTAPFDFPLTNRQITAGGRVIGGWTGRSPSWPGDAFFDGVPDPLRIPNTYSRRAGANGLILLYIIHRDAQGRSGAGVTRDCHSPVFGVSIPEGGPPFRRVLTRRG